MVQAQFGVNTVNNIVVDVQLVASATDLVFRVDLFYPELQTS